MRRLTFVEIDVDYCALSYGVSPCTAAIPTTGDIKCFNSIRTCQDPANFSNVPVTLRFAMDTAYLPRDILAIPSLTDVALTPATIELGEGLGTRASITVSFKDHRHPDTGDGFDKYVTERGYDPFKRGTFWGKFRARQPYLQGRPLRLIRGELGQSLGDMEVRHYVIENFDGPRPDGSYSLVAKDILKLADDDRAQAPLASNGYLVGDITNSQTSATLSPAGIGSLVHPDGREEYPASGYVCIGGNEICSYTRVGDALTITRGALGTTAATHKAEERVQLVLRYVGQDPADIIADLLLTYANVDPDFVPLANWQEETDAYLKRQYTATIPEPVGVNTLITELVQQAGLGIWWDDVAQIIRLMVLRPVAQSATELGPDLTLEETISIKEQPEKRISEAWTFFAQRDPTKPLSNEDNYKSIVATIDADSINHYGSSSIKKRYARWIPEFGRSIAERANDLILGRFAEPPRRFDLALLRGSVPDAALGRSYNIGGWPIQDVTGAAGRAPAIITRIDPGDAIIKLEAEEALFKSLDAVDLFDRVILIESDTFDFNLRTVHDLLYPEIVDPYGITLTCIVQAGVTVGSTVPGGTTSGDYGGPAFHVGSWVPGLPIHIINRGNIFGPGGRGISVRNNGGLFTRTILAQAQNGGTALYTRYPILFKNEGILGGGGGGGGLSETGGGGQCGGGGAGALPGAGGDRHSSGNDYQYSAEPGTALLGGRGRLNASTFFAANTGNCGGALGSQGFNNAPGTGMAAVPNNPGAGGPSIDGVSYVTDDGPDGDRRGSQIN